ncbi:hypothetical protein LZY01_23650 [Levilactobacillus zymae]|uniref:Phage protein n=1 Tax=Levilactobacillus zymae TaxID=267363 RepID=A0ABQ0X4K5_9LACO|nr:putative HNHc nuclease [Levilactobacillus zymae]QFR61034.1 hypothetical protein LZ395_05610 [Levilactobacillus zymae]GEO73197.1 hypothetical protein LZY01_23650 [Levilactobacillus zymae]
MQLFGKIRRLFHHYLIIDLNDVDPPDRRLIEKNIGQLVEVRFDDGRHITADQRRKVYAMISEVDRWCGNYIPELTKGQLKRMYALRKGLYENFSLSDCSIETASRFIEFLLEFCFENNIPFASQTVDAIREQYGWDIQCLKFHRCMICGRPADIAHVHAVGIGRNRNHISHVGNSVMALCRDHHQEQHRIGIKTFMQKNQLKGVRVTPEIAEMLQLGNWRMEQGEPIISTEE